MLKLFYTLRIHLIFIILINILYTLVYLFRPQQLDSYWIFLYTGVCIFISLATGWVTMHELQKRRLAVLAGLIVFVVGYLTQLIGLFLITPLVENISWKTAFATLLKFVHYGLYYALIAVVLAFIGAHICNQYERHKRDK